MTLKEEKILTALKHFAKNTKYLGRTKLFKLLYFWDFRYFSKHGKSITGFAYKTYKFGPVPEELFEKIIAKSLPEEYLKHIEFVTESVFDEEDSFNRFSIKLLNQEIDYSCLTGYEFEELNQVVEIFEECTAKDIVESSHLPNQPWAKTKEQKGMNQIIDYLLALDKDSPIDEEEAKERLALQGAFTHNGYN